MYWPPLLLEIFHNISSVVALLMPYSKTYVIFYFTVVNYKHVCVLSLCVQQQTCEWCSVLSVSVCRLEVFVWSVRREKVEVVGGWGCGECLIKHQSSACH